MFGRIVIYGHFRGKPQDGKNSGFMQSFPAGPDNVKLAGGAFLAVPRAVATQVDGLGRAGVFHKPQRARCCQDQAQRIGSHEAFDLAALILAEAVERIAITNRDFYSPPVAIRGEAGRQTQREVRGEKRLDGRRRFARAGLAGPFGRGTTHHHHTDHSPREYRIPQAFPNLHQGRGFAGVRRPAALFAG